MGQLWLLGVNLLGNIQGKRKVEVRSEKEHETMVRRKGRVGHMKMTKKEKGITKIIRKRI